MNSSVKTMPVSEMVMVGSELVWVRDSLGPSWLETLLGPHGIDDDTNICACVLHHVLMCSQRTINMIKAQAAENNSPPARLCSSLSLSDIILKLHFTMP